MNTECTLDRTSDNHRIFFSLVSTRSIVIERFHFFLCVLWLLFECTSMFYRHTYACPLVRLLARQVASAVDRRKIRCEEQTSKQERERTKKNVVFGLFLFSYKTNHSATLFLLSQCKRAPKTIVRACLPACLSIAVSVFTVFRPHHRRCRTLRLQMTNQG